MNDVFGDSIVVEKCVHVIGGGLAGCEASWQLANQGIPVLLHEMRPTCSTDAHKTDFLAELVCSNSFRSDDSEYNCVGLLHQELSRLQSLIMETAYQERVPAGGALAIDRDGFSNRIQQKIEEHPLITLYREEIEEIPATWDYVMIATGPLTSEKLSSFILKNTDEQSLAFFDAIAPILYKESVNFDIAWIQSRYDKGDSDGDYINCPMNEEQYESFVQELIRGEKINFKEWEMNTPYFSGCLPIEVMAERGLETLRWGPMKPVGLTNKHKLDEKPYAVVQLRCDNKIGSLYNMVGFQTKLRHPEQTRIFKTIPGLENAEFARLGGMHRNTYLNSPKILDTFLRLKSKPRWYFAGQITGCEGYVESTAIGLLSALFLANEIHGKTLPLPPLTSALGALHNHITGGHIESSEGKTLSFQPMNVNFGLMPPLDVALKGGNGKRLRGTEKARAKKLALTTRARNDFSSWLEQSRKAS